MLTVTVTLLPDGESWHPQTQGLWAELRRSPLMRDEPPLTWQYMIDTAVLHHQMWQHGESKHAAELRLRFAQIGITPADRQRLKVRITERVEAPHAPAGVADIAARRARLTE